MDPPGQLIDQKTPKTDVNRKVTTQECITILELSNSWKLNEKSVDVELGKGRNRVDDILDAKKELLLAVLKQLRTML